MITQKFIKMAIEHDVIMFEEDGKTIDTSIAFALDKRDGNISLTGCPVCKKHNITTPEKPNQCKECGFKVI